MKFRGKNSNVEYDDSLLKIETKRTRENQVVIKAPKYKLEYDASFFEIDIANSFEDQISIKLRMKKNQK